MTCTAGRLAAFLPMESQFYVRLDVRLWPAGPFAAPLLQGLG